MFRIITLAAIAAISAVTAFAAPQANPQAKTPIMRPVPRATATFIPQHSPILIAIANCPAFPGQVIRVSGSRQPGFFRNGDTITVTGHGFGEPGPYSMLTMWQKPPPWQRGELGYSIERVSWTDRKIVGRIQIRRLTRYEWDSSTTAYLEIQRTKDGKPVKCGVRNLRFTRFPE